MTPMYDDTERYPNRDDIIDCAHQAEDALRRLARITIQRPSMTPADIDIVLAQLAGAVAALPQAATQLSDMLGHAQDDFDLAMDTLTDAAKPDVAIDTARLHLDEIREPAVEVYRRLDAAHQETAHISTANPVVPIPGRCRRRHVVQSTVSPHPALVEADPSRYDPRRDWRSFQTRPS
ncbi:MAG: hypothetical protein WKF50_13380 [Nocardioides sp.]